MFRCFQDGNKPIKKVIAAKNGEIRLKMYADKIGGEQNGLLINLTL